MSRYNYPRENEYYKRLKGIVKRNPGGFTRGAFTLSPVKLKGYVVTLTHLKPEAYDSAEVKERIEDGFHTAQKLFPKLKDYTKVKTIGAGMIRT